MLAGWAVFQVGTSVVLNLVRRKCNRGTAPTRGTLASYLIGPVRDSQRRTEGV
jgi:hypothetical protein